MVLQKYMQKLSNLFKESFFKFLLTFLIIFIPLYPKFPSIRIPGIYVSIRLEDFIIFISLICVFVYIYLNKRLFLKLKQNIISRSIVIFLIIGLVSLISAVFLTQTASSFIAILHWVRRIEYFSLFFIGLIYIKYINTDQRIYEYFIKLLLIVNLLIFFYGFGQKYFHFPVITTQNEEYSKGIALWWIPGSHINSTFAGHYDLASYLVLTLPIFVATFFVTKSKVEKLIFATSIAMGFWLLTVAISRISVVAFVIGSIATLLLLKKYKEILVLVLLSVVVFSFSADLQVRYKRIYDVVRLKLTSVIIVYGQEESKIFEDRSTSIRLNVEWPRAIRAFSKNPLLGTGYSSITLATDNNYLRILGEVGILGFVSFILIFNNLFKRYVSYRLGEDYKSIFRAGIVGSTIAIFITAIFIDIFEASKFAYMFWLFTGISVDQISKN